MNTTGIKGEKERKRKLKTKTNKRHYAGCGLKNIIRPPSEYNKKKEMAEEKDAKALSRKKEETTMEISETGIDHLREIVIKDGQNRKTKKNWI